MTTNITTKVTREDALVKKKAARTQLHLVGFGNNRFPEGAKEMSDEQAARGLANFAKAALGIADQ